MLELVCEVGGESFEDKKTVDSVFMHSFFDHCSSDCFVLRMMYFDGRSSFSSLFKWKHESMKLIVVSRCSRFPEMVEHSDSPCTGDNIRGSYSCSRRQHNDDWHKVDLFFDVILYYRECMKQIKKPKFGKENTVYRSHR